MIYDEVFEFFNLENKIKERAKELLPKNSIFLKLKNEGQGLLSIYFIEEDDNEEIKEYHITIKEFCHET